ncbi:MAG: DUF4037 domain-containing protein [Clostridia bacterium]|nr:DUF4037 domain-containing protein [Clostridia bacterium]
MKGIELSEKFYLEYGKPMLEAQFPELMDKIAVGICGSGSECVGYDDEISQDHDFEPGFCIFIPDEGVISSRVEFALERAYTKLPKEFMGYKRSVLSPVGGNRHGVIRASEFLKEKTGTEDANLTLSAWITLPEQALLEATNGKIFHDGDGRLTRAREALSYLPEDVRLKKLAGNLLIMAQSGLYNYPRCLSRGETASAQLAIAEYVKSALNVIFLLNKRYIPYYKWTFRALRELPNHAEMSAPLEYLLSSPNGENEAPKKLKIIEEACAEIITALKSQGLTSLDTTELEPHAYAVNNKIVNNELRNLHILCAI